MQHVDHCGAWYRSIGQRFRDSHKGGVFSRLVCTGDYQRLKVALHHNPPNPGRKLSPSSGAMHHKAFNGIIRIGLIARLVG